MEKLNTEVISTVKELVRSHFENDTTGHDWYHIERVWKMACYLQEMEGGDLELIELAALLHDISDHKLNGGHLNKGGEVAGEILSSLNYPTDRIQQVAAIIDAVSYKGAGVQDKMDSLEGKIVQDADRLDAIGAIGIGRAFAYGGSKGRSMYDPKIKVEMHESFEQYARSEGNTINHFYEKLLLLKDRLHTETAKKIGLERHEFMEEFLSRFFNEWRIQHINN